MSEIGEREKISKEELIEIKGDIEKSKGSSDYHNLIKQLLILSKKQITRDLLGSTMIGKLISSLTTISSSS